MHALLSRNIFEISVDNNVYLIEMEIIHMIV
jgi:hypothetical protein